MNQCAHLWTRLSGPRCPVSIRSLSSPKSEVLLCINTVFNSWLHSFSPSVNT